MARRMLGLLPVIAAAVATPEGSRSRSPATKAAVESTQAVYDSAAKDKEATDTELLSALSDAIAADLSAANSNVAATLSSAAADWTPDDPSPSPPPWYTSYPKADAAFAPPAEKEESVAGEGAKARGGWMPFAQQGAATGGGFAAQGTDTAWRFFTDPNFDFQKEGQAYQASGAATGNAFGGLSQGMMPTAPAAAAPAAAAPAEKASRSVSSATSAAAAASAADAADSSAERANAELAEAASNAANANSLAVTTRLAANFAWAADDGSIDGTAAASAKTSSAADKAGERPAKYPTKPGPQIQGGK